MWVLHTTTVYLLLPYPVHFWIVILPVHFSFFSSGILMLFFFFLCSISPIGFLYFFHSFFSFCSSDWIISNVLSFRSLILLHGWVYFRYQAILLWRHPWLFWGYSGIGQGLWNSCSSRASISWPQSWNMHQESDCPSPWCYFRQEILLYDFKCSAKETFPIP